MNVHHSFPPLVCETAKILILGSMPGQASLDAKQYYAHPRNLFWPFIFATLRKADPLDYAERCNLIMDHNIAVWDVLHSCLRKGSLDSAIEEKSIAANNFVGFFEDYPHISTVFFNGAKAEQSFNRYVLPTLGDSKRILDYYRLPSTSPANASISKEKKLSHWSKLAEYL